MRGLFWALLEELFMNKWLCLFVLFLSVLSFGQITVEVNDEQVYNASMLGLRMRVVNNSGQSYDNVTVDFYLKKNPSETFALDSYYTEDWTISIAEQSGENVIIRATIPHLGAGTSPNSSGVSVGIHRTDWQPMSKTSANGFPLGSTFTTALNYNVFQGNNLIGGSSYIDPSLIVPSLRFVGLQPTPYGNIPSWIEIENYGTTPANLSNISLKWATSTGTSSSSVSSAVLEPGKRLRICPTQLNCPDDDLVAAVPMLQDVQGEILLRYNTTIMDYLSWGYNDGVLASDARLANIQYSRIRYDFGFYDEYWHKVEPGIFYKKIDGKWYSYTPDYDVNTTDVPDPIAYHNEETICLDSPENPKSKRNVRFAWHPVEGAIGYKLTIIESVSGDTVYNGMKHRAYYDKELEAGTYEWSVRVVFWSDKYSVSNPWIDHYTIWKRKTVKICNDFSDEHYLRVPQYAVHKDTRMLVPNWGELAEFPEISWDHPDVFVYNQIPYDSYLFLPRPNDLFLEVSWRCWVAGAQMLNHFYKGNLTQDEIKFHGKTSAFEDIEINGNHYSKLEKDKIAGAFGLGGAGSGATAELFAVLMWALNIEDQSQMDYWSTEKWDSEGNIYDEMARSLTADDVVPYINAGRPMYVGQNFPRHIMILDGYRYSGNEFQIHLVNISNGGEAEWVPSSSYSMCLYIVPPIVSNPKMSDHRVHIDSDGDGIVDFDEVERFKTNPFKKDSDGDDIDDKVEIFSYTIKEEFVSKETCFNPKSGYDESVDAHIGDYMNPYDALLCRVEKYADIDGDSARAELDVDSDHPNNDGLPDGAEDLNHNGYVDNGETDPYNISDDYSANFNPVETVEWDAPSLVGIYAFNEINVGNNVTCNSGMHGYCQIASEYALPYAVSVGVNSTVGDIFSKGNIQLQNNAHAVGDVHLYSLPTASVSPVLSQGASVTGTTSEHYLGEWPYLVSDDAHHSLDGKEFWNNLIVNMGETFVLSGGESYGNIVVHSGGTLKLGTGTIRVGNITLNAGSRLEFMNPGRETVIIADGNVIWNPQIVNSDLQTVAKGFKLIEYAPGSIHIEGDWAGTIHARWCELTLGQGKKTAYGSFVAKKVNLGEGLTIYRVHFSPIPLTDMV